MPQPHAGLSSSAAARGLLEHGPNALPEARPQTLWRRFVRQFQSPLIYVLLFALVFDAGSWLFEGGPGVPVEAVAIALVLLLNAGLGTFQEARSERALSQLRALSTPLAWVFRDGRLQQVRSEQVVPGDLVRVEAGERIPADGTTLESSGLTVDESLLTGESLPIEKRADAELNSGALVVRGNGLFRVTRTGIKSTMGRIAGLLAQVRPAQTPLEKRLAVLGQQIARAIFALSLALVAIFILVVGLGGLKESILFAVALAVAAVPEGMPAVVTLTLALGVQRMARHNAIVRRLSAVEALGSVTVIATDKTGTLTENRFTVSELATEDREECLRAMVLANEAEPDLDAGDPLELSLIQYARAQNFDFDEAKEKYRRLGVRPFDSDAKFMRVTVDAPGGARSYLKGAPEVLLERARESAPGLARWHERATAYASRGLRVLALASAAGEREDALEILGLVALGDPARAGVPAAVAEARRAGIRVLMVTGDHPDTARRIAEEVGIEATGTRLGADLDQLDPAALAATVRNSSVFARVSPEHKLQLIEALQRNGEIVAMTGDGVNDAPALKRAEVGIAMGRRGSAVAREAADIVLQDDDLATIVHAIEEGRDIYENIQSFIRYTFSTNVSLVFLIVSAAIGSYFLDLRSSSGMLLLPLTAAQLLWINFLGDGPPALAFALDRNPGLMARAPRPAGSPLLDRCSLRFIAFSGFGKGVLGVGLLLLLPRLGYSLAAAQTAIFLYESIAKLLSSYAARSAVGTPAHNLVLHGSIAAGSALQVGTVASPALRRLLGLERLDLSASAVVAVAIFASFAWASAVSAWLRRHGSDGPGAKPDT